METDQKKPYGDRERAHCQEPVSSVTVSVAMAEKDVTGEATFWQQLSISVTPLSQR
jgi:hypothetical protein